MEVVTILCTTCYLLYVFPKSITTYSLLVGSETAVNTLTDIFVEYFGKLCKLFKINVETQNGGEKNNEMIYVCRTLFSYSCNKGKT